jgi:hypothetical protein
MCGVGAAEAKKLGLGEGLGAGVGVEAGGEGLTDEEVALDNARTEFAKPTVIVQTLFSGCAPVYFKIAMHLSSEDRKA